MPVNLPPQSDDFSLAAWYLELVREINRLEAELTRLEDRVRELEG